MVTPTSLCTTNRVQATPDGGRSPRAKHAHILSGSTAPVMSLIAHELPPVAEATSQTGLAPPELPIAPLVTPQTRAITPTGRAGPEVPALPPSPRNTPPVRPNVLPSHAKLPPQIVMVEVFESRPSHPSNAKLPPRGVNTKVCETPTHGPFFSRIVIDDWGRNLRNGFQPSRQQYLPAIIFTTAAGAQRSGSSLPTFLPRGLTPDQALQIAQKHRPVPAAT